MGECRDIDECFLQTHACVLTDGQEKVPKSLLNIGSLRTYMFCFVEQLGPRILGSSKTLGKIA